MTRAGLSPAAGPASAVVAASTAAEAALTVVEAVAGTNAVMLSLVMLWGGTQNARRGEDGGADHDAWTV